MIFLMNLKNMVMQYWISLGESWRYAITVFVIARVLFGIWSWVVFSLQPVALQNFELFGEPILSIFVLKNSEMHLYLRQVNGEILTFRSAGNGGMIDQETGTIWNIADGRAMQGRYKDTTLAKPSQSGLPNIFPYQGTSPTHVSGLGLWQRFDANLYTAIAENGYGNIPGDTHFPPLFPLLIRLLQPVFGEAFLSGLFVSHLATLYMLKLLGDIFMGWGGPETGKRAVLFFAIYPTFFFFFSAYSESVFLVCSLLALRNMNTRSWAWSGFWTFCSILTRLQGAALMIPMIYLMLSDPPFLRKTAHWAGLVIAGFGGVFYLFLRSLEGTGSVFPSVESEWLARLAVPGESFLYGIKAMLSGSSSFIDLLNFVTTTMFLSLIIIGWKRIPLEYNLFAAMNLLILSARVVETQPLNSMIRFSLTLFPAFYTLGILGKQPWARRIIIYISLPLSLYLSGQFFVWGWVA